jgi:hypothetical protein
MPSDVIKGSLEVRSVASVATEWEFSVNTWDGQKTLSIDSSIPFPEPKEPAIEHGTHGGVSLICPGYMNGGIKGFGARIPFFRTTKRNGIFRVGGMCRVAFIYEEDVKLTADCKIVSLRESEDAEGRLIVEALFVVPNQQLPVLPGLSPQALEVSALKEERDWREVVCGNLAISREVAEYLYNLSKSAFEKTKKKNKLDERYSKHQIAAFDDELWVARILRTATHNSFAKHIISFKVPISRLPNGSLFNLLLKRITLAFGRFAAKPMNCWIVGYSLAPAEDAVRLEVINSEPMEAAKQNLWLDENLLKDQLTIDEQKFIQEFYSEK